MIRTASVAEIHLHWWSLSSQPHTHQVRRADGREAEREQERAHLRELARYVMIRTKAVTKILLRFYPVRLRFLS
eukprot:COSAG01_NODE_3391_length_6151_cov_4.717944_8_plen_74_part_00